MRADSWQRAGLVSLAYFGLVFGAGFLLGPLRVLVLEPRVGARWAELIELPLMLVVIVLAARWVVRGPGSGLSVARCRVAGLLAMGAVLVADFGVGIWVRGMTPTEVLTLRDPVSGIAYYLTVLAFGLMPWWLRRRAGPGSVVT